MRVRGKVVDGGEVEVVTADERGVSVDAAAEQELAEAMKESDVEEGVPVEEAFARLPQR
jgi:hypothetical protein